MTRPALSASRAVEVLNYLALHPGRVFTLSELARRLDVNLASCHAVLGALEEAGYVARHPVHKTYGLGPAAVALGRAALERHPQIGIARDEMRRLAAELDLEVIASARVGDSMVAVAREGRHAGARASLRVGQRVPLRPPLGSCFVAWEPEASIEHWLELAGPAAPPAERSQHRAALRAIRDRGFSVGLEVEPRARLGDVIADMVDEPRDEGLRYDLEHSISDLGHDAYHLETLEEHGSYALSLLTAPVFDADGHVSLVLTLLGFRAPLSAGRVRELGERLRDGGLRVTRATGGKPPSPGV